jgi:circadian clock protein KaiB
VQSHGRRPPEERPTPRVELVLFVSSASQYAHTAVRNCERVLARIDGRRVRFEVVDVSQHPERAEAERVVYTPMLLKRLPLPRVYVLGDLSNSAALLDLLESCGLEPTR